MPPRTNNEVENCIIKITESIKTMNHSSERIANALEGMAVSNAANFGKVNAEHVEFRRIQSYGLKIIMTLIGIVGALVGYKTIFP